MTPKLTEVAEAEDATGAEPNMLWLLKVAHCPAYTAKGTAPQKYPPAAIPIAMISCIKIVIFELVKFTIDIIAFLSGNTQDTTQIIQAINGTIISLNNYYMK